MGAKSTHKLIENEVARSQRELCYKKFKIWYIPIGILKPDEKVFLIKITISVPKKDITSYIECAYLDKALADEHVHIRSTMQFPINYHSWEVTECIAENLPELEVFIKKLPTPHVLCSLMPYIAA